MYNKTIVLELHGERSLELASLLALSGTLEEFNVLENEDIVIDLGPQPKGEAREILIYRIASTFNVQVFSSHDKLKEKK